ncbi:MAG: HlyD family efflux transporter periplasmic adaptor subunit [Pirellulales bacterium]|nr:HlyD family efflux transporter periplasmic adaptor subunit [Pirellulales bacterium]
MRRLAVGALAATCLLAGCQPQRETGRWQGYVEGEFVYIASPRAGELTSLEVARGTAVSQGDLLFALEDTAEQAAVREADQRLAEAQARLADARKGLRPTEVESLAAQLKQAQSALEFSEREAARVGRLVRSGSVTEEEFDRVNATRDQNRQRVVQLEAELATGKLGSRTDQIAAAEANVEAMAAARVRAQWNLDETRQTAPSSGLTFDTLYQRGEWVPAGSPVVALLPPEEVKVRFFIPQALLGTIELGANVRVRVDGAAESLPGRVSFISPRAEYTPPVIYSRESRQKLVFMVEAAFDRETAAKLHPGQPVDVELVDK